MIEHPEVSGDSGCNEQLEDGGLHPLREQLVRDAREHIHVLDLDGRLGDLEEERL